MEKNAIITNFKPKKPFLSYHRTYVAYGRIFLQSIQSTIYSPFVRVMYPLKALIG
jgi:hypothetical protein